jgi:hypothetical protein
METKLYSKEGITLKPGNDGRLWCHVSAIGNGYGVRMESLTSCAYMEIRKKENKVATFLFARKSQKRELDLGWWSDAEVVYSVNEVIHD